MALNPVEELIKNGAIVLMCEPKRSSKKNTTQMQNAFR
jgi:hypothetical protein